MGTVQHLPDRHRLHEVSGAGPLVKSIAANATSALMSLW